MGGTKKGRQSLSRNYARSIKDQVQESRSRVYKAGNKEPSVHDENMRNKSSWQMYLDEIKRSTCNMFLAFTDIIKYRTPAGPDADHLEISKVCFSSSKYCVDSQECLMREQGTEGTRKCRVNINHVPKVKPVTSRRKKTVSPRKVSEILRNGRQVKISSLPSSKTRKHKKTNFFVQRPGPDFPYKLSRLLPRAAG